MPTLTRRRDVESRQEHWLIYYGDVHVGTIAVRSGIPHDQPQWGWRCGFYPGWPCRLRRATSAHRRERILRQD
jgi:hypothetical protein